MNIINNTPCTLVTGFLGSGKSTFINQLLTQKSTHEKWGLLINEFGQIGIDSSLINQPDETEQSNNSDTIAIREVNGGCICCTSQLPLQIALSRLMAEHTPSRLLIEPTGLAHPKTLLEQLSEPHWQTSLSMQNVVCLLNARQWHDARYRENESYRSHVKYADLVMVNRFGKLTDELENELEDELKHDKRQQLVNWITDINPFAQVYWIDTEGKLEREGDLVNKINHPSQIIEQYKKRQNKQVTVSLKPLLSSTMTAMNNNVSLKSDIAHKQDDSKQESRQQSKPQSKQQLETPYRYHESQNIVGGFLINIGGWRLPPEWIFDYYKIQDWLLSLNNWQRIKGVIHTDSGWLRINFTIDSLSSSSCPDQIDSRIEIILMQDSKSSIGIENNSDGKLGKITADEIDSKHVEINTDYATLWEQWDKQLLGCKVYG